jgi:hypothetical protein
VHKLQFDPRGDKLKSSELTLFSWGYKGWGNATDKLVEAVDAVERSRGSGPPVFVDVRAKRGGRAEGFKDNTFRDFVGEARYRWMKGLGNRTVLERGGPQGRLVDASQAAELLELALALHVEGRRVIFYCSCGIPQSGCHRHWIAPELFRMAKKGGVSVTVVEWPGVESGLEKRPSIQVDPRILDAILSDKKKNVPLGPETPTTSLLGLPWLELVDLEGGDGQARIISGPAEFRAGKWQLPILGGAWDLAEALKQRPKALERCMVHPRRGP